MAKKEKISDLEKILEKNNLTKDDIEELLNNKIMIDKSGYTTEEIINFSKALKYKQKPSKNYRIGNYNVKFLLVSDRHIGNINYDKSLNKFSKKIAKEKDVDFILDCGDILDGWYQNRPTSLFEQNAIGLDEQLNMAVEELKGYDKPYIFITGNHTYNTYMRGAGIEIGPYLENKLTDNDVESTFLGNGEGDITLKNKCKLRLMHPDGGTAYAISYKPQKIVESITGGSKPSILMIGHFHKSEYIFYRNIHIFQAGCFEGQTKFMKGKHIPAMKGFWYINIDCYKSKPQINRISMEWYPSYKD